MNINTCIKRAKATKKTEDKQINVNQEEGDRKPKKQAKIEGEQVAPLFNIVKIENNQ